MQLIHLMKITRRQGFYPWMSINDKINWKQLLFDNKVRFLGEFLQIMYGK